MTTDAARLARIRALLAAIAPGRWSRVHDADGCFIEAAGPMGELLSVARFHAGASDDEITFACEAPELVAFLLGLVDRAIERMRPKPDTSPPIGEPQAEPKNFAAECAMLCGKPGFKTFLEERHGLERPLTDDRAAQKVRSLLGVTSRAELNDGGRPAEAWRALRSDFAAWRREAR